MVYLTIVSPELAEGGEIVQTTPEHPFYVVEGSEWSAYLSVGKWVDAGNLHVGDTLRKADGSLGIVGEVNVVVAAQVMYNLTVDQAHTFFVGDGQWLVHNADCPIDVFAFGNSTKPRSPRPGDFNFKSADPSQRIPGQVPPSPHGASTFADPLNAPVSGHYHKLPAGTQLPDGIDIIADGSDVLPGSMMPPTHHTIFNTKDMTFGEFTEIFDSLPWQYGGNKKK